MGRMLDALRQAQARRNQGNREAGNLQAVWPEEGPESADNIPFVEVGGPRGNEPAPALVAAPALARQTPPALTSQPTQHMSVQFRPLRLEPTSGRGPTRFASELIAYHQPEHPGSVQYRDLASGLLAALPTETSRIMLFAASMANAGTTTAVLNVAITLAKRNDRRVLVVDAHLRRPAVAGRLGLGEAPGLREVLAGRVTLESAVRTTGLPNLSALTAGCDETTLPARLASESMRSLLQHLRETNDLVLVDGPRWDGRPEIVALGCACDAVFLCVPEAEKEAPETADLLQVIPEQGATLCGCLMTRR